MTDSGQKKRQLIPINSKIKTSEMFKGSGIADPIIGDAKSPRILLDALSEENELRRSPWRL